ncbi:MAG: M23 family metallopeptidase [Actinomycetota bacterium]|nr:M23 family metallopeptidase [Actinomycetota bacterium]
MGQFPVAGSAHYADDWLEARPGPVPALHPGIDIVAALGTPLRAPVDGTLVYDTSDPGGYGLMAVVTGSDKTFYRMAHMSATVKGLNSGSAVKQGQVVGFVGSTGNSTGPHCHFETHPLGGAGVDSKPILDAWQAAAIKAVPVLIRAIKGIPDPAAVTVPPLQVALPVPQPAFFPSLTVRLPAPRARAESVAGLALLGLLALLASSGLAVGRYGPGWRSARAERRGLVQGRDGPSGRVRLSRWGRLRGRVAVDSA